MKKKEAFVAILCVFCFWLGNVVYQVFAQDQSSFPEPKEDYVVNVDDILKQIRDAESIVTDLLDNTSLQKSQRESLESIGDMLNEMDSYFFLMTLEGENNVDKAWRSPLDLSEFEEDTMIHYQE